MSNFSGTRAVRIRVQTDGVRIRLRHAEGTSEVRCSEVVLAGGALETPRLIRSSRLGKRWRRAGNSLSIHPATKVMAIESAIAGLPVPLHPGAARYYQEVGVDIPARLIAD